MKVEKKSTEAIGKTYSKPWVHPIRQISQHMVLLPCNQIGWLVNENKKFFGNEMRRPDPE